MTVSITRRMTTSNHVQIMAWFQAGASLAETFDGFLGTGWVRTSPESNEWHALYRFRDQASLDVWQESPERRWWLDSGGDMVEHVRSEHRVGIEGWFDEPAAVTRDSDSGEIFQADEQPVPPRWKQMIVIFIGFFPVSLVAQWLLGMVLPPDLPLVLRVLVTIMCVMPIMVYVVLPFVTRKFQPWLEKSKR